MTIDLFTLIAQIINFLILVLLLRHFLYKRIVRAMDERERRISLRMEEAENKKKEAEQEAESYQKKKGEIQEKREQFLSEARQEADTRRKEMVAEARQEVDQTRKKWHQSLQRQKQSFLQDLRSRAGEQIYFIARKVLQDLADEELEVHIMETFLRRLQNMEKNEQKETKEALQGSDQGVIRSVFKIPQSMKRKITLAVREMSDKRTDMIYESAENLICGIELEAGDRKISWSIDSYLSGLEEKLQRVFEQEMGEESQSEEATRKKEKNDG